MRRTSEQLDNMLENAVATALGLDKPHPETPRKRRHSTRAHQRLAQRSVKPRLAPLRVAA